MSDSICIDCVHLIPVVTDDFSRDSRGKCDLFSWADVTRPGRCDEYQCLTDEAVTRKTMRGDHQESNNGAASTAIEGDLVSADIERLPDPAPTVLPTREACLSAARDAIVGGREVAYGSPEDNFARIARLWAAFLHNKTGQEIAVNETDVALMLDLVKTARLQFNPGHVDSWVDKAGYSACGCEIGGRA